MPLAAIGILGALIAYLLGGFPSGVVIGKRFFGVDIREHGSHNIGMTNTMRILGVKPGLAVLALDAAKGAIGVAVMLWLISAFAPAATATEHDVLVVVAALAAVLGHVKSPYLHFKGGKGVATGFGVILVFLPLPTLAVAVVFFAVALATRYVSLSSMTAAVALPVATAILMPGHPVYVAFGVIIACFILWAHRANIKRLASHTEPKFKPGNGELRGESR